MGTLHNIGFCTDFLDVTLEAPMMEEKIDKQDFKKINFCVSKTNFNMEKDNPKNGRSAHYIHDKLIWITNIQKIQSTLK